MAGEGKLAPYLAKRRFERTPEPAGRIARTSGNSFVIQKHAATRLHYDLRLELDGVLKSWAVTRGPSLDPSDKRLAVRTEDHPLAYSSFEGIIPQGNYGAGTMIVWDRGTWHPEGDAAKALDEGKLSFRLEGERLSGEWTLVRLADKGERRENWLLIKGRDAHAAADVDVTTTHTTSVISGLTIDEVAAGASRPAKAKPKPRIAARSTTTSVAKRSGKLPDFTPPALATLVDTVPEGPGWLFEIKFDGYRGLAAIDGKTSRIFTRSGQDWTHRFGPIPHALAQLELSDTLLDGEIVVFDKEGKSDFGALQAALKDDPARLSYVAFDLLIDAGEDIRSLPLSERKARLKTLIAGAADRALPIHFSDHAREGEALHRSLCGQDFEGVIAKRTDAPYPVGRSEAWLKVKCAKAQEFVVIGFSPSDKGRPFASLLLGLHGRDGLRYAGRVGSGLDEAKLAEFSQAMQPLLIAKSPAPDVPRPIARRARWVRPELVVQVAFAGFTKDGLVRQARLLGRREDKPAAEVAEETIMPAPKTSDATIAGVHLTNPDRILFPEQGTTKRDLADYLHAASQLMLPHLSGRLVSLVRCPEGRKKQCFFQRHGGAGLPAAIKRRKITEKDGDEAEYVHIPDETGLISAAQMGVLEYHIWGSRLRPLEKPDRLVFDLDPDPTVDFEAVKDAAFQMRDALYALGLKSLPLLTGGKGVHVVVPLKPAHEWPVIKAFARALAEHFATGAPDRFVATMSKAKRTGRIFIDHFRNERGATAICPYSPRARENAPVAWPVTWDTLPACDSAATMTIANAADHLSQPDPWADYEDKRNTLKATALKALNVKGKG